MDNEDHLVYEFVDKLIKSPTHPGEIHTYPICNGILHVWFGAYRRDIEILFGVQIKCDLCGIQMALDYGGPLPPWLDVESY